MKGIELQIGNVYVVEHSTGKYTLKLEEITNNSLKGPYIWHKNNSFLPTSSFSITDHDWQLANWKEIEHIGQCITAGEYAKYKEKTSYQIF